jgi:hypothetical protein
MLLERGPPPRPEADLLGRYISFSPPSSLRPRHLFLAIEVEVVCVRSSSADDLRPIIKAFSHDQHDMHAAIIRAGTAGLAVERAARQAAAKTLLIGDRFAGTTCATVGCMPS